jgi:hypothetical protein
MYVRITGNMTVFSFDCYPGELLGLYLFAFGIPHDSDVNLVALTQVGQQKLELLRKAIRFLGPILSRVPILYASAAFLSISVP